MDSTLFDPTAAEPAAPSSGQSPAAVPHAWVRQRLAGGPARIGRTLEAPLEAVPPPRTGAGRRTHGVARVLMWIVTAIAEEVRIRRDMRQLRAMNDHMLRDIGLSRADIDDAVRHGRD